MLHPKQFVSLGSVPEEKYAIPGRRKTARRTEIWYIR
jgi:hypothetical protein